MADEEEDFPIRHVILYAKGHYYWSRCGPDLLKICKKINPKVSTTKHIVQLIGPVIFAALLEQNSVKLSMVDMQKSLQAYIDQWVLLVSLRYEFKVDWLGNKAFVKLSFEEQDELKKVFQEEFDSRVLQAFISPLIGWVPTVDLGEPSHSYLPVVSPEKGEKHEKK